MTNNHPTSFYSISHQELERRWPIALSELRVLLQRLKDIRPKNINRLPQQISDIERKNFTKALFQSILELEHPKVKRTVARKIANKIGDYLLWRRETSIPVIHELVVLLPWWFSHFPNEIVPKIRDIGLKYILNGQVLPVQTVWQDILNSKLAYLGHCVCRSAGIVDDLDLNGHTFNLLGAAESQLLVDRLFSRYHDLMDNFNHLPDTDQKYIDLFKQLDVLRPHHSPTYILELFLQRTYAEWEILPILDKYTLSWVRSLHNNRKAHLLHKELVFEFSIIQYLARGSIFSSMKLIDTPYTICSCPTPELGGGCILTNWYYYSDSQTSIVPNETVYGRRKDAHNNLLPCRYFPSRNKRDCIGCGCHHQLSSPRNIDQVLSQADEIMHASKTKPPIISH